MAPTPDPFPFQTVPEPLPLDYNRRALIAGGTPQPAIRRLQSYSDVEFEEFVYELVHGCWTRQYEQVVRLGGAGDRGRDIAAYARYPDIWDLYQCKHYDSPLAPAEFWVELGKLCHYSFTGAYAVPRHYYVVTSRGLGPALHDLLTRPGDLNAPLIAQWDGKCRKGITSKQDIVLEKDFRLYVEKFDFSIVRELPPLDLIELHSRTRYHAVRFGGGLTRKRPRTSPPPEAIEKVEIPYVQAMFAAFGEHLSAEVGDRASFGHSAELCEAFDYAREGFYSAEALKEFARENLPDEEDFEDLLDETFSGIRPALNGPHTTGYARLVETTNAALGLRFTNSVLEPQLRNMDRVGFCHHLVNRSRTKWVRP